MNAEKLLPCPFCNSDDLHLRNTHTPYFWVECDSCGAQVNGKYFEYRGKKENAKFSYEPDAPKGSFFTATELKQMPKAYQRAAASAIAAWNTRPAPTEAEVEQAALRAIARALEQPEAQAGGEDLKLADELDEWALAFIADSGYSNPTLEAAAKTIRRLTTPPATVPEVVGWLHEVVWEDGTERSFHCKQPKLLGPRPGMVSERIGRAAMLAAAPDATSLQKETP